MMAAALTIFQVRVGSSESNIALAVDGSQEGLIWLFCVSREFVIVGMSPGAIASAELGQVCLVG